MTHDDLDISGTHLGERFAAIRDVAGRDAGVRMLERVRLERSRSGQRRGGYFGSSLRRWSSWRNVAWIVPIFIITAWQILKPTNGTKQDSPLTYTTQPGQRASITLRDGSRVTLGPATTLQVHNNPSGRTSGTGEVVEVDGEALFQVSHSATRAFLVKAHGVTTRVLGTEFVVYAYDISHVRVAVRDGRVSVQSSVSTPANAAIVAAGEAATVTPNALPYVSPIGDLATDFAWASGDLVLRDVPLGEALVRLSRWYAMDFRIADSSLLKARVAADFPAAFSETEIVGLAKVIGARTTRSGNTITFSAAK